MAVDKDSNYPYDANKPAAIFFAAVFLLLFAAHFFQAVKGKTLYMIPLLIAVIGEIVGYITRFIAIKQNHTLWPIITSQVALIVSPAFLAAQSYMIVGRMMAFVGPGHSLVKHGWITKIFVLCDVLSIVTQSGGGAMLSGGGGNVQNGRKILIGGLALQVISFGIFIFIAAAFDIKSRRSLGRPATKCLRPLFTAFYVSAALITGRSIYRTIEFASINFNFDEQQGYLVTNEWPFYVLDSVPITIAVLCFNFVHPSSILPAKKGQRLDGTIEMETKRSWFGRKKEASSSDALTGGQYTV
jgi:drug/metabolite transporter superfamily protein YnfA